MTCLWFKNTKNIQLAKYSFYKKTSRCTNWLHV